MISKAEIWGQTPQYVEVLVDQVGRPNFEVVITSTEEGCVIDVFGAGMNRDGMAPAATCYAFDGDLVEDETIAGYLS